MKMTPEQLEFMRHGNVLVLTMTANQIVLMWLVGGGKKGDEQEL